MFVYSALGDSITYGQSASSVNRTYPCRIISMLRSKGTQAKRNVLARPGWTSADLADELYTNPRVLHCANVVSVWIGGDDLIQYALTSLQGNSRSIQGMLYPYKARLDAILRLISTLGVRHIICCTQYNPFPNSLMAVNAIRILNQAITATAANHRSVVASVDQWFSGNESRLIYGYRSGDIEDSLRGFAAVHPNDQGHELIATGLLPLICSQGLTI